MRQNAEKGFRLLMASYKEPVYWHIRRLVVSHADAQDVAQETFVRIFRNFQQYNEANSFKAWIFRIATNEALRLLAEKQGKYIAHELAFDEQTTQKFLATWLDYQKEVWALGPRLKKHDKDSQTDAEAEQAIKQRMERSQKILDLREKYYKKYSAFLTQKQIERVYELEQKAMKKLSKKGYRTPRGKGQRHGKPSRNRVDR